MTWVRFGNFTTGWVYLCKLPRCNTWYMWWFGTVQLLWSYASFKLKCKNVLFLIKIFHITTFVIISNLGKSILNMFEFEPLTMLLLLTWAVFAVVTKCWTNDEKIWILCGSNIFNNRVYLQLYPYFISRRSARAITKVSDKWKTIYIFNFLDLFTLQS